MSISAVAHPGRLQLLRIELDTGKYWLLGILIYYTCVHTHALILELYNDARKCICMHVLVLACMYVYTHRLKYVCDTNICICMYRLTDFTALVTYLPHSWTLLHSIPRYGIRQDCLFEGRPKK